MRFKAWLILLVSIILIGCTGQAASPVPVQVSISTINPSQTAPIKTATPSQTPLIATNFPATATATLVLATPSPIPTLQVCSPLEGITQAELLQIVTNPFEAPHSGQDDGHQGVDFSFYRYGSRVGMTGLPINAVLSGKVASVVKNRLPYGNIVIIETPLDPLLAQTLQRLKLPEPIPTVQPSRLTCPSNVPTQVLDISQRSLYLLYAHMNQPTTLKPGDPVGCGQKIGEVGNTGLSSNPHLHLEVRIGPSGARFSSLAHYTGDATLEEMANYCTWRVSGLYQLIDPLLLLTP